MENKTIGIIDYNIGNITSIKNGFDLIKVDTFISNNPSELEKFNKIVLIGVGSFPAAMKNLNDFGFSNLLLNHIEKGGFVLGICIGMQLLMSEGNEFMKTPGLNLIKGTVDSMNINNDIKVPHVGWNNFDNSDDINIFDKINIKSNFYFVHSFSVNINEENIKNMKFNYSGKDFIGAIQKNNIYGVQFHPEKSQEPGLQLLKNFSNL